DYVVYRVTRSNVGPWGLSRMTERHPLYLSPAIAIPSSLSGPVAQSLAARQLLVAGAAESPRSAGPGSTGSGSTGSGSAGGQVQVQGDLGIAVAFQQRARVVLDARVTGTEPGEPWRILLLPQPEGICLQFRIDALGIHQVGLYQLDEALSALADWLPRGSRAGSDDPVEADALLAGAERAALLTVTRYNVKGSAETAGASTDLVLARKDDRLHVLARDRSDRSKLVPSPQADQEIPDLLAGLLA
ncbi:MAG TPA: hypothetical protein VE864_04535, partial [Streptosporangiaceae bacterium]|nr:hypothetical protein [Streptosporangiaceae bacterium]